MSFFCLLWVPLLYLLRSPGASSRGGGYLWALLLGCAATVLQYFAGPLVPPGEFGLSRWLGGFIDIASLPVLLPLVACRLLIKLKVLPGGTDHAGFALLYLVPLAAYRSVTWSSPGFPEYLVVVPLLWTAQAVGIPFFLGLVVKHTRWHVVFALSLGVSALPVAAATSWWAFYCQRPLMGLLLSVASLVPATVSVVLDFLRKGDRGLETGEQDVYPNHRSETREQSGRPNDNPRLPFPIP